MNDFNPRDYDNYSTMICFHKRYDLGDSHDYRSSDFSGWDELERRIRKDLKPVYMERLSMQDHSGLWIKTGSPAQFQYYPWDAGYIGFVVVTRESIENMNGKTRMTKAFKAKLEEYVQAEILEYNKWLNGIEEEPEEEDDDEIDDSQRYGNRKPD